MHDDGGRSPLLLMSPAFIVPRTMQKRRTFAEATGAIDDASGPMGIRLVIHVQNDTTRMRPARPAFVLPLGASIVTAQVGSQQQALDKSHWWVVPKETPLVLKAKSPVAHTVVLTPSDALIGAVIQAYAKDIEGSACRRHFARLQRLARTNWVNEVCHRYVFERATCNRRDNDATRFLEMELVKEMYFLCGDGARASVLASRSGLMQRALRHMETHLFEADVMRSLGKAAGASESTLLRTFRRELGQSPLAYLRARRLDEALLLLKSGRYSVGEVSLRVGYQNVSAFSAAFRTRFGRVPTQARATSA